jgi:hypothetical protein
MTKSELMFIFDMGQFSFVDEAPLKVSARLGTCSMRNSWFCIDLVTVSPALLADRIKLTGNSA